MYFHDFLFIFLIIPVIKCINLVISKRDNRHWYNTTVNSLNRISKTETSVFGMSCSMGVGWGGGGHPVSQGQGQKMATD